MVCNCYIIVLTTLNHWWVNMYKLWYVCPKIHVDLTKLFGHAATQIMSSIHTHTYTHTHTHNPILHFTFIHLHTSKAYTFNPFYPTQHDRVIYEKIHIQKYIYFFFFPMVGSGSPWIQLPVFTIRQAV
jgi:hypothetical protein